ncbi:MAG TPA: hypothetical protein VN764_01875, partial [Polyangiaceae bacterium]|nr:hypothetical protein [Polyangiaceae bacterium]
VISLAHSIEHPTTTSRPMSVHHVLVAQSHKLFMSHYHAPLHGRSENPSIILACRCVDGVV